MAVNTSDPKGKFLVRKPDAAQVAAIPDEITGMVAGTGKSGKIQWKDRIVIEILSNRVVIFDFNCYHKNGQGESRVVERDRNRTLVGADFCLLFIVTILYNTTKGLRIKQSAGKYIRIVYAETLFILNDLGRKSLL